MSVMLITMVLSAAVLHACWNALAKSGGVPEFSIAAYQLVGALICCGLAFFVPTPDPASWPMIFASVVIHNGYYFSLAQCYRAGDLSQMYPLFRGLAPVIVALGGMIFVSEYLPIGALIGIGLISLGLVTLSVTGGGLARATPQALRWALLTSVLIAAYTLVDGVGVRSTENGLSYILWLFIFEPVPIGLILLATRRAEWLGYMRANPGRILAGAVASSSAYGLVIFAMSLGAMAIVSSLRETSVIFAALIGALVLREPFGQRRVAAAVVVACGVLLIHALA